MKVDGREEGKREREREIEQNVGVYVKVLGVGRIAYQP